MVSDDDNWNFYLQVAAGSEPIATLSRALAVWGGMLDTLIGETVIRRIESGDNPRPPGRAAKVGGLSPPIIEAAIRAVDRSAKKDASEGYLDLDGPHSGAYLGWMLQSTEWLLNLKWSPENEVDAEVMAHSLKSVRSSLGEMGILECTIGRRGVLAATFRRAMESSSNGTSTYWDSGRHRSVGEFEWIPAACWSPDAAESARLCVTTSTGVLVRIPVRFDGVLDPTAVTEVGLMSGRGRANWT